MEKPRKKRGDPKPFKAARDTVYEFAGSTTVHGIAYIFDTALLAFERAIWLVAVIAFAGLAIYWSSDTWKTWKDNQVITSVKSTGLSSHLYG